MESKAQGAATKDGSAFSLTEENTAIYEKCHVTIRCKPLGKGASDSNEHGAEKVSNKIYDGSNHEKHTVSFRDTKKKSTQTYKFPNLVATEEIDNEALYNDMMKH